VPPSIVMHEYLPALAVDPTVLARMGLRMSSNPGSVQISQPPGDHNALGRIRFNFPNKFLVYQHDTPDKNLFALDRRAFSHGCMRVQEPVKYAEVLLSIVRPGEGYSQDRIRKMIASMGEQDIQFPHYLPVHQTYQTAFGRQDFQRSCGPRRAEVRSTPGRGHTCLRGIPDGLHCRRRDHESLRDARGVLKLSPNDYLQR
jgi:murein L,D-transpeptidase YcbB/YkuD